MTAVFMFAAGFGTRMRHLTADQPKPLVKVAGRALIDHALDLVPTDRVGRVMINLHFKGDMIRNHLVGRDVIFSEEPEILETGGGLKKGLATLGAGPVLTLNTDAVWHGPNPVDHLLSNWQDHMECLALIVPKDRAVGHKGAGDFLTDRHGRITRGRGAIYTGVQMIRTERIANSPKTVFGMMEIWEQMIADGTMYGTTYAGHWCDVGQPESIPLAETMLGQDNV